jgi:chemotaxis protein methyltransferase CheR
MSSAFVAISQFIEEKCGIVLHDQNAHLLESRLGMLFDVLHVKNLEELYVLLCIKKDIKGLNYVIEAITTNETFWFRDKGLWAMLEGTLLPEWIHKLQSRARQKIRIWSAACSYGQEPYSIVMCIDQYLKRHNVDGVALSDFEIVASDISMTALKIAQLGKYDSVAISRGLDEKYKESYFRHEGKTWHLHEAIISAVQFRTFNLLEEEYGSNLYDMVLCRNVLIYFSKTNRQAVYKKISLSLINDGILLIGSSELLEEDQPCFSRESDSQSVFFKKKSIDVEDRPCTVNYL